MSRSKKSAIAVVDLETDPFQYGLVPKPFAAGYYDADHYVHFWGDNCVEQLMNYLLTEEPKIIYAHNGGKFDFFYFLDYLDECLKIINGRIAQATILDNRHELRDSYCILPMPLKTTGVKKVISYRKMRRQFREKYKEEILSYLYYDCKSLYDWVSKFRDLYGGGLTLAGAAFKQLKGTGYVVTNTFDEFDKIFRPFYFGGRVQCFEVGAFYGNFIYVDINSAYPYAMKQKHWQGSVYMQVSTLPKDGNYFAIIEAVSRGALPIKVGGKLTFPNDTEAREYAVSGWEIQAGIDTGTLDIKKLVKIYKPTHTANFVDYVDKFFAIKLDAEHRGDNTERTFAKLMLNSAYGKFGQDGRQFEDFAITPMGGMPEGLNECEQCKNHEDHVCRKWRHYSYTDTGHALFSRPAPVDRFFNVATAASITGYVRAYLWRALCASERPIYCDTDAIICEKFHGDIGEAIGQWDVEAEPVEMYIAQKKMYALKMGDGSVKKACKGVRLKFNQIKDGVLNKQNIVFKKSSPALSLKYGARFFSRKINFAEYEKNV